MLPNIVLKPAAVKFISRIVRFSGLPAGAGFRLAVTPGGCSGYSSEFSAEAAPGPGEQVLEIEGLRLFLGAESRLMLEGVIIDFADTPTQSGLTFTHPNQAACGCSSASSESPAPVVGVTKIEIGAIGRGRPATLAS
jgi:iron-sulfur cluster assembly accessory protein